MKFCSIMKDLLQWKLCSELSDQVDQIVVACQAVPPLKFKSALTVCGCRTAKYHNFNNDCNCLKFCPRRLWRLYLLQFMKRTQSACPSS